MSLTHDIRTQGGVTSGWQRTAISAADRLEKLPDNAVIKPQHLDRLERELERLRSQAGVTQEA